MEIHQNDSGMPQIVRHETIRHSLRKVDTLHLENSDALFTATDLGELRKVRIPSKAIIEAVDALGDYALFLPDETDGDKNAFDEIEKLKPWIDLLRKKLPEIRNNRSGKIVRLDKK